MCKFRLLSSFFHVLYYVWNYRRPGTSSPPWCSTSPSTSSCRVCWAGVSWPHLVWIYLPATTITMIPSAPVRSSMSFPLLPSGIAGMKEGIRIITVRVKVSTFEVHNKYGTGNKKHTINTVLVIRSTL